MQTDIAQCTAIGGNCDPDDGMSDCCDDGVCVDNKRTSEKFEADGFADAAVGFADFVRGVGDFGRGFDKFCIPKEYTQKCVMEAGYCDVFTGQKCCNDDATRPLVCSPNNNRLQCLPVPKTPPKVVVEEEPECKFYKDMYEAGNPSKVVAAKACTNLDCATKTLCVKVMAEDGYFIQNSISDTWIKDYNTRLNGFKYIPKSPITYIYGPEKKYFIGWKACFDVSDVSGVRDAIEIHANFGSVATMQCGRTASTGKKQQGYSSMTLCP